MQYLILSQELICHSVPAMSVQPVSMAGTSTALGRRQTFTAKPKLFKSLAKPKCVTPTI